MPTQKSIVPRYYPRLSSVVSEQDIPDILGFIKTGVVNLLNKIHYKDLQYSKSAKGDAAFYSLSIVSNRLDIEGLTKSLAAEFASHKIRINAIAPSLTDTKLAAQLLSSEERRETSAKRHPLQKIGNAKEIAKMVVFLLSDSSSWITGQIIGIDGGIGSLKI